MVYSLFILFGSDQPDLKINEFVGNTSLADHVTSAVKSVASNAVGFEVGDTFADKLTDEKSVALTGNMITEMTYNVTRVMLTKFETSPEKWVDKGLPVLKYNLTVKGNLEFPNILFALGVKTAKKKDTSKIWQWANTPVGFANSESLDTRKLYYRHVVANVFAPDERQFRSLILKDAFVGSYEEYYDTNGEGHFTLVINKILPLPGVDMVGNPDIKAEGPTWEQTFSSVTGDIGKAMKSGGKLIEDAANATEKVLGKDNDAVKKMHNAAKLADKGGDDVQKVLSDGSAFNPDDIAKEIDEHANMGRDTKHLYDGDKETKETTTKPEIKYLDDKSTETTVTKTNPDGSKDIEITIKKLDGTVTVKKQHEDHSGFNDW